MIKSAFRYMSVAANRATEGPVATSISNKIRTSFPDLKHYAIYNDSYKHAGHRGMAEADNRTESHFRVEIVSDKFKGLTLPKRHRLVYTLLGEEFENGLHALQLTTRTVEEQIKKTKA
ncbi:LAMI_0F05314g1_1 [Lachancea mirantina]|uniref:LAMI_0F05314g1_1 n=1 Tax=Lachancea mirantina TaxID=1230905 RepID=A0A1G4JYA2_9SACH|nr:LAMI_0F05314g1_1 [Lachancea mirantina]